MKYVLPALLLGLTDASAQSPDQQSLVAKGMAALAAKNWPETEAAYPHVADVKEMLKAVGQKVETTFQKSRH
jgi:hypothetical protein